MRKGLLLLVVLFAFVAAPVRAATPTLTVSVDKEVIGGQFVVLSWTGLKPSGDVFIHQCPEAATTLADCMKRSPLIVARSDGNGAGSRSVEVFSNNLTSEKGDVFFCNADHPCRLAVVPTMDDGEPSFADSLFATITFAYSTVGCPASDAPTVAGSGSATLGLAVVQWQSEICRAPHNRDVSYIVSNSPNGLDAFVKGLTDSDFAGTSMPLSAQQAEELRAAKRGVVYAPVALTALAFAYNLWVDTNDDGSLDTQVRDLQLSPPTIAGIFSGRIASWNDPGILADNPKYEEFNPVLQAVARADSSGTTFALTSWFYSHPDTKARWEEGGDSFKTGPTSIYPGTAGVDLRTGSEAVARQVLTFNGKDAQSDGIPLNGLIGAVDRSVALQIGLPMAKVKNPSGAYVAPDDQAILAGLAGATTSSEGFVTPDPDVAGANAYPLPFLNYILAPTDTIDYQKGQILAAFLKYGVGDGQKTAAYRGYAPLPGEYAAHARTAADKIPQTPPPATPSPAPASTNVPASANVDAAPVTTATSTESTSYNVDPPSGGSSTVPISFGSVPTTSEPSVLRVTPRAIADVVRNVASVASLGIISADGAVISVPHLVMAAIAALLVAIAIRTRLRRVQL